jgi:hypothetical protein
LRVTVIAPSLSDRGQHSPQSTARRGAVARDEDKFRRGAEQEWPTPERPRRRQRRRQGRDAEPQPDAHRYPVPAQLPLQLSFGGDQSLAIGLGGCRLGRARGGNTILMRGLCPKGAACRVRGRGASFATMARGPLGAADRPTSIGWRWADDIWRPRFLGRLAAMILLADSENNWSSAIASESKFARTRLTKSKSFTWRPTIRRRRRARG